MTTRYERRGNVAVLQIDNPPVNGLGHVTRRTLAEGLERALDDSAVKVVVITGTDKVFSGGADIREFNTPAALAEPNLLQLIDQVERSPKPVIAAINGVCMGGGLELSLGCNYRIATPDASMGLPEVKIGLLPGAGGTQRLPRAVGAEKGLRMITTGDPIKADDALEERAGGADRRSRLVRRRAGLREGGGGARVASEAARPQGRRCRRAPMPRRCSPPRAPRSRSRRAACRRR